MKAGSLILGEKMPWRERQRENEAETRKGKDEEREGV